MTRRALAATLIAAAAATTLAGCGGVGATLTFSDVEKVKVSEIVLTGDSGNVLVRTAAIAETRINRIIRRSSDPDPSYQLAGTVLTIDTRCGMDCTASYDITAPVGVTVRGELQSGDIGLTGIGAADVTVTSGNVSVHGATGDVAVKATSGDVDVLNSKGKVTMQATSGNLRAFNVAGPVDAHLTSGDVDIKIDTPASVTAETTSGDVTVLVPGGAYDVRMSADSGESGSNGVTVDPNSKFKLDLAAKSGDVTLSAVPTA